MSARSSRTVSATRRLSRDPWVLGSFVVLAVALVWSIVPLATGATGPVSSGASISLEAPIVTAVTPSWTSGDPVELASLTESGDAQTAASSGWETGTNWMLGYEIRVRATTEPALRGANAVDGQGALSSFADYTRTGCPCPWSMTDFDRGAFGYSISVTTESGVPAEDTAKWGTSASRRWRGFSRTPFRAYATSGGQGRYVMTMHLRTAIPDDGVQREGSYRAGIVVSAHALM